MLKQTIDQVLINTNGQSLVNITEQINLWIKENNCIIGILNLYIMHTSASLIIQENADPSVLEDLISFYEKIVPMKNNYKHYSEGRDDMPAHIKSSLTNTSLSLSIKKNTLTVGVWQSIYLFEHRHKPNTRKINLHYIGE